MAIISHFDCAECGMKVGTGEFHPHLYCTMFKTYRGDPQTLLENFGFVRTEILEKICKDIIELSQAIPPGILDDKQNGIIDRLLGKVTKYDATQ